MGSVQTLSSLRLSHGFNGLQPALIQAKGQKKGTVLQQSDIAKLSEGRNAAQ
jgi:hypothetical protein